MMKPRSKRNAQHLSFEAFQDELQYQARTLGPKETRQLSPYVPNNWYEDKGIVPESQKAPGSGFAYVQSPFIDHYSRQWGVNPIADMPKYRDMYRTVPVVHRAIDKTVMLAVSKGCLHEFDEKDNVSPAKQKEILAVIDEFWNRPDVNQIEYLTTVGKDLLIFGWHVSELCYDDVQAVKVPSARGFNTTWIAPKGELRWLKPLDPLWMRMQRDSYGNRLGFLQYLSVPPQALTNEKVAFFIYSPWSITYESAYGTSMLMSLIRTQDLIWTMEADLAVMAHAGAKPPMTFKGGSTDQPYSWSQLSDLQYKTAARGPGSDVYIPANVEIAPSPQPQTMVAGLMQYLYYLHEQRIILLGVPPQLLGVPEGSTRTTAEVSQTDFIISLQALQNAISEGVRYQIYARLLKAKFGEDCPIPRMKWHEIFEQDMRLKTGPVTAMFKLGIVTLNEARVMLGHEPIEQPEYDQLQGPIQTGPEPGAMPVQARALPADWPNCAHREFMGHIDEFEVWVVDSDAVGEVDARWTDAKGYILGNNHYGQISYYIPELELWISDRVPVDDRQRVARHEYVEAILVRGGMPYEDAHNIATEEETKVSNHTVVVARQKSLKSVSAGVKATTGKKKLKARPYSKQLDTLTTNAIAKLTRRVNKHVASFLKGHAASFKAQDEEEDYNPDTEFEGAAETGYKRADYEVSVSFNYTPQWAKELTAQSFPYIDKMDHELAVELADAMGTTRDRAELEKIIAERIEPTYENRAATIAREEISRIYGEAYRQTIQKSGIQGKFIFKASLTACDICIEQDGTESDRPHINCECYQEFVPNGAPDEGD